MLLSYYNEHRQFSRDRNFRHFSLEPLRENTHLIMSQVKTGCHPGNLKDRGLQASQNKILSLLEIEPRLLSLWPRGSQTVRRAHAGGAVSPLGRKVVYMTDIFILNDIWAQDKIYILVGTLLG
jgi:hypothetical protein